MHTGAIMSSTPTLTPLKPIPIKHIDLDLEKESKDENSNLLAIAKKYLRWIQKWSLFLLASYLPLHGINTLIIPSIEPSSAPNDVLMMIRELTSGLGSKIIWTGIAMHVLSGLGIRVLKMYTRKPPKHRKKNDLSPSGTESIAPSKIGLVGGLSGYFIGVKRQLNYNPQVLTGWLLTPLLIFHGILMKILPQSSKVDIDFDFVKWLLNKERGSFVRWGLGYGPLIALIGLGTYHIFSGTVQYLHIRNLKTRKRILNFMIILACSGIVGLNRLGSQLVIGMDRYYQPIIKKLLAK